MRAGRFLQVGGPEGWEADLARSTAEGVGGFYPNMEGFTQIPKSNLLF